MNFRYIPLKLEDANRFVAQYHRHNKPVRGHKFSIGIEEDGELVGVAIVGRPVARGLDNGMTLEINRLTVKDNHPNVCSRLYNRCREIVIKMGYTRLITYTLQSESGSSLRAIGCEPTSIRLQKSDGWINRGNGRKEQAVVGEPKYRWDLIKDKECETCGNREG